MHHSLAIPVLAGVLLLVAVGSSLGLYLVVRGRTTPHVVQLEPPSPVPPTPPTIVPPPPTPPPVVPTPVEGAPPEEITPPRLVAEVREPETIPPPTLVAAETPRDPHRLDQPAEVKKPDPAKPAANVKLKPLTRQVLAGLDSLVKRQSADGSWGGAAATSLAPSSPYKPIRP